MGFGLVQVGFLAALTALAIPIFIHLIFRQQPKRVEIGSIRFLHQVLERHRGRRKTMRWLLLALRLTCITLLAILFARPFFSELSQGEHSPFTVVLIDQSASMQLQDGGQSLVGEAIEQARDLIRNDRTETRFQVGMFSHKVFPVTGTVTDNDEPAASLNGRQLDRLLGDRLPASEGFGTTDYAEALRWARDLCVKTAASRKTVHLFTDMQQSGLDWSEVESMPSEVHVHLHDLGRSLPSNVAVTAATPSKLVARENDPCVISVTVLNAGPFALEEVPVVLQLRNEGRTVTQREKIKLGAGAITSLTFDLPGLSLGLWQGDVSVETIDALRFDNRRHLAVMVARPYDVLLVDGDRREADVLCETYFLESALRLAPRGQAYKNSPYSPTVIHRPDRLPNLSSHDVVVLANVGDLTLLEVRRLEHFVRQGGGLVAFAGDQLTGERLRPLSAAGLTPGELITTHRSSDLPWRIGNWNRNHSILRPFSVPEHGDLGRLSFWGVTEVQRAPEAETIASLETGVPLVVSKPVGKGEVLWFLSSCDQEWNDWSRSTLFLPVVHQILGHVTGLNAGGPVRQVVIDSQFPGDVAMEPGVFRRDDKFWEVVNVSARESETERCTIDDFVDRFAIITNQSEVRVAAALAPTKLELRDNEVAHWFVFLLIALLSVEFFIANRTTA